MLNEKARKQALAFQKNEITEHGIYARLARACPENREILERISRDEHAHYERWKTHTGADVKPCRFTTWKYYFIARILGLTFAIKLMERGEKGAQTAYREIAGAIPEAAQIAADEDRHEDELIKLIDEERLKYIGSIVLGLNDALVELTGALAGFTFTLSNPKLIAATGLITGIAASLSMAASEYLSTKSEGGDKHPVKASLYTGLAYVLTVAFLITPYLLLNRVYLSLGIALGNAIVVIFVFNYYISVVRDLKFGHRFGEMVAISLGIAALTFGIGYLIKTLFHIEV